MMHTEHRTVPVDHTLESLVATFQSTRESLVWVVDGEGHYRGAIDVQDVLDRLTAGGTDAHGLTHAVPALSPSAHAGEAIELLARLDEDEAPVVDEHGVLVGVLHERALLSALRPSPVAG
jgi:CBS domain-containing protein